MGRAGGKKKKTSAGGDAAPPKLDPDDAVCAEMRETFQEFLKRAHELKEEGNKNFAAKDYVAALANYENAMKLTPKGHYDLAILHSNRAACLLHIKPTQYDAVIAECSLALQIQPKFGRALSRRARAYEAEGKLELALADTEQLLQIEPSNQDGLDLLKRIRGALGNKEDLEQGSKRRTGVVASSNDGAMSGAQGVSNRGPSLPAKPVGKKRQGATSREGSVVHDQGESVHRGHSSASGDQGSVPKSPSADALLTRGKSFNRPGEPAKESKRAENRAMRPLKLIYGHDIRLAEMPVSCRFGELRDLVGQKFPSSKAVLIKYKDCEGDLVTITSTSELRLAENGLVEPNRRLAITVGAREGESESSPSIQEAAAADAQPCAASPTLMRLYIVEVSPEQEPPIPDNEHIPEQVAESVAAVDDDHVLEEGEKTPAENAPSKAEGKAGDLTKAELKNGKLVKTEDGQVVGEEMEIDDWLFDFAQLFRNHVGIDPDGHVDFHELGMELCSEALESIVTSEEAQPLFEAAAAKFQEVAALAFFNWGNVYMCAARKRVPMDDANDKPAQLKAAYGWAQSHYKLAGQKYEEALKIKPDFYEGVLALGQEKFESAKLQWAAALDSGKDLKSWDSSETLELYRTAEERMRTASEMWEQLEEQQRTASLDPSKSKKEGGKADEGCAEASTEAIEQGAAMRSQINLFWGNVLFEHSQVEYLLGLASWKDRLDRAVKKFKAAGASSEDISGALKNHPFSEGKKVKQEEGSGDKGRSFVGACSPTPATSSSAPPPASIAAHSNGQATTSSQLPCLQLVPVNPSPSQLPLPASPHLPASSSPLPSKSPRMSPSKAKAVADVEAESAWEQVLGEMVGIPTVEETPDVVQT